MVSALNAKEHLADHVGNVLQNTWNRHIVTKGLTRNKNQLKKERLNYTKDQIFFPFSSTPPV